MRIISSSVNERHEITGCQGSLWFCGYKITNRQKKTILGMIVTDPQLLRELMTSTEGLIGSHGPILFWFGLFWHGTYGACTLLQATSGEKWVWRRPRVALGPSPGNPGGALCCLMSPAVLTSPSCPERGWETPNFCSSYGYHTAWVFCNKLSFFCPLFL